MLGMPSIRSKTCSFGWFRICHLASFDHGRLSLVWPRHFILTNVYIPPNCLRIISTSKSVLPKNSLGKLHYLGHGRSVVAVLWRGSCLQSLQMHCSNSPAYRISLALKDLGVLRPSVVLSATKLLYQMSIQPCSWILSCGSSTTMKLSRKTHLNWHLTSFHQW